MAKEELVSSKITVRVEQGDYLLEFTEDDLEGFEFTTPRDRIDITPEGRTAREYRLGKSHFNLIAHFKEGAHPTWKETVRG
jgi:hypothetical protein